MTAKILSIDHTSCVEHPPAEQPPARIVAGALAHLARHMETGCQRSAYLAAMLLQKVANDPEADEHLRHHARELVDILDRDTAHAQDEEVTLPDASVARLSGIFMGTF